MYQPQPVAVTVEQITWVYRGTTEDANEKDFFHDLEGLITLELRRRFPPGISIRVGREVVLRIEQYGVRARVTHITPPQASVIGERTKLDVQHQERAPDEGQDPSRFFTEILRYPNERLGANFDLLVGMDDTKQDIMRKLILLLDTQYVNNWVEQHYPTATPSALTRVLRERYPLIILEGEVGSGKTALARSLGHPLAKALKSEVVLLTMNSQVRGGGHVGELTQNIVRAFEEAERIQEREQIPVLLLIDEADALAQARGSRQTHHEDDAGVNALIQRIDRLRGRHVAVIFATNLLPALDSAIMRRAMVTYRFDRPTPAQRADLFQRLLAPIELNKSDLGRLVQLTEARPIPSLGKSNRVAAHRYTYSDISQRIIPRAVEEAVYAREPLQVEHLIHACQAVPPTPESPLYA